jgi:hypothetical protein
VVFSGIFFGAGNVVQSTPVVNWTAPAAITYGTGLSATQLNATASFNSVNVPGTFVYSPAAGTVLGAGSKPLSVTFTPTDTVHYTTATGNTTQTVNQATPTVAWPTPSPITTGTALSATQLDATANLNGTSVSGSFVYTPAAGTVPATGSQTLSVSFTPTDSVDYTTASGTTTLMVTNQSVPVINWPTPSPITAGTALGLSQLNATASFNGSTVNGTFVYSPAAGTIPSVGSQTLSVTFTPTDTVSYVSANASVTLIVNPSAGAQASFGGIDTMTQGNWQGVYGADGYDIVTQTPSLPSYASTFAITNPQAYTWVTISTDPRALQAGVGSTRVASTWYNAPTITMDVNLTDGGTHRVALYAVDWDTYAFGRAETLQVVDANSGTVLDSRNISGFTNGVWVYWNITGHVKININNLNSASNVVFSGIFFK